MKKIVKILIGILSLFVFFIVAFNNKLKNVEYVLQHESIKSPLKIVFLSDLHNNLYGEKQIDLINRIKNEDPDLIVLGGDIFEVYQTTDQAEMLLEWIGKHYPAYYVTGNHEYYTKNEPNLKKIVRSYGIHVLEGETTSLDIDGNKLQLMGIDDGKHASDYQAQLEQIESQLDNSLDSFNLMISHRPEIFNDFNHLDIDLILSGHTHGGQWRLPFLINGLFAPDQGVFPKYAGGQYDLGDRQLIISRGLIYQSKIPRIFNRPEFVILKLEAEGD